MAGAPPGAAIARRICLGGLDDLLRADAAGADANALRGAVHDRAHGLQVRFEAARADIVGVGHRSSNHRALVADFTASRHDRNTFQGRHGLVSSERDKLQAYHARLAFG